MTSTVVDPKISEFFKNTPQPNNYSEIIAKLREFLQFQKASQRKIVFLTSGGTTVPLEKNTVRYLDNFSGGGRGSAAAEYFIQQGYAVIFLYRTHSLQPFTRQFIQSHSDNSFLNYLTKDPSTGNIQIRPEHTQKVSDIYEKHKTAIDKNQLFKISFQAVHDYLFYLRGISQELSSFGKMALLFLAAAVSDYYIPTDLMVEHKIQSSNGRLDLTFEPVPKMLGILTSDWAPNSFIVSFKLETDPSLLEYKAKGSLSNYGHQLVVANLLSSHKDYLILYLKDSSVKNT